MRKMGRLVSFVLLGLLISTSALSCIRPVLGSPQYSVNAVWIADNGPGWPRMNPFILTRNLTKVVNDLAHDNIQFAMIFVGYWDATDPTHPTVPWFHDVAFYQNVIDQLHAVGVKAIAWIENSVGTMDISATNRQNVLPLIKQAMDMGFDGYNDDIESWVGQTSDTVANNLQQVDWLNYLTPWLHNGTNFVDGKPRLNMPDVGFDWTQSMNQYLDVDYIVSMFYSNVSTLESAQAPFFWQEEFGEYEGHNTPPASPVIIGLMNYYGNQHPLAWQLNEVTKYLSLYGHPQLVGFSIWLYEYMGTNPDDWMQWKYWISQVGAGTPSLYTITIDSTPMTGIPIRYNGAERETPDIEYAFTGTMVVNAPSSVGLYYFSHWQDGSISPTLAIDVNGSIDLVAVYAENPPPQYGSISVYGTSFALNVTFQAWIDNNTPVQVPTTGYTFTNVTVGSHTVHAIFNATNYDADASVVEGLTTTVPFNFQSTIAELPCADLILIVIGISAIFATAYAFNEKKRLATPQKPARTL
jgi:hypothetical protein